MAVVLRICDETISRQQLQEITLRLASERLTVRDLIRARVKEEVRLHNAKGSEVFQGLVQPTGTEKILNGYRVKKGRQLDPDKQLDAAEKAFHHNGFIMFVDDGQVETLDDEVVITPDTRVSFIKLVPLVGG